MRSRLHQSHPSPAAGCSALLPHNHPLRVQDEAAGLVVALLAPQPGEALLDACAAPGGKTLFSAARMQARQEGWVGLFRLLRYWLGWLWQLFRLHVIAWASVLG